MSTTQLPGPSAAPVDRSARLMVLGGFQILLGLFCGLMAALLAAMVLSGRMPQGPPGQTVDTRSMIPAMVIYVPIAVAFIWLGIGMILCRRWAWALTLVSSWMGLICGLFATAMATYFMGQKTWDAVAQQSKMPPEMETIMRTTVLVTTVGVYVVLPGVFVALCQPPSVRDTVYRRDTKSRWTDRCPLPVLAICLMLAIAAVSTFALATYNWVLPIFGYLLSGIPGAAVICLVAIVLALLAWGNYRLNRFAWWGTLLMGIVSGASSAVTLWRGDILAMYEKMGFTPEQIDMIRKMGMLETLTRNGPWMNIAFGAAWVCYLLYVRRYFVRTPAIAHDARS